MSTTTISPRSINQARLRAGLTQEDVAFRLRQRGHKANGRSIQRWEGGSNVPRANVIPDLAAVLGVTIETLYERSPSGDDDEEEGEPVRVLRAVAAEVSSLGRDDLASDLLGVAARIGREQPSRQT